ncbi:helix-turn-helix transcriptional regulator [uncultured Roseobacter sp.]|uniref:helix-turn-helix domain-containing protein n=1 Tax=uncultured Roseobacter sp. TaxID=114847 RepID=UPI0026317BBD|nr:helix-turn-helix transcriptional regulator [uncultured Roseobacter sp.]
MSTDEFETVLRELIRERRKDLQLTQTEVAGKVGRCDHSHISRIENGVIRSPSKETIKKIIDALGYSENEFYDKVREEVRRRESQANSVAKSTTYNKQVHGFLLEYGDQIQGLGFAAADGNLVKSVEIFSVILDDPAPDENWTSSVRLRLIKSLLEIMKRSGSDKTQEFFVRINSELGALKQYYNKDDFPMEWAECLNIEALSFIARGSRIGGSDGQKDMRNAIVRIQSSLEKRHPDFNEPGWGHSMYAYALATFEHGVLLEENGFDQLGKAIQAFRESMQAFSSSGRPFEHARSLDGLASALAVQGSISEGDAAKYLLNEACHFFELARNLRMVNPIEHAETEAHFGRALLELSRFDPENAKDHLNRARRMLGRALTVFDKDHCPYQHVIVWQHKETAESKFGGLS